MTLSDIPTEQDIKAAYEAVEAVTARNDLPTRAHLRLCQSAVIKFFLTCERFHAQREGVDILNFIRCEAFKRTALSPEECPRLYTTLRTGTRRSSVIFYPSASRIARAALVLPGARHRVTEIANALGADVRNVKALWTLLQPKEARHV